MVTIKLQIFWLIDWLAYFSQFVILINFLQLFLIIQGADVCRKSRNCQLAALLVLGRPWRAYRHLFHGTRSPVAGQWVSDTFFKTVLFSLSMARTVDKQKKGRRGNFVGEYACHVRSISIRGSNRYRESAGRVGWATSRSSFRCQSSSSIRSTNPQRNFSPSNPPKK
jgi:hypothetical protein